MTDTPLDLATKRHRFERNVWIAAAPAMWVVAVLVTIGAPHIAPYLVTPHTWVWCIVFAAYHQDWLRAHRDIGPVEAVEETTE